MRRFAQIVFPPWVRTTQKVQAPSFFVPAQTKIAVKLLKVLGVDDGVEVRLWVLDQGVGSAVGSRD